MLRQAINVVVSLLVLATAGCGGGNPAGGPNPPAGPNVPDANPNEPAVKEPPVEKRWASLEAVLAAAPKTPLTPQEVICEGETFLMDLPAGANLIATSNNN